MKVFISAIILLLLSISESAYAVTVIGVPSCGNWVHDREADKQTEQAADIPNQGILNLQRTASAHSLALLYVSGDMKWIQGYISGLAVESGIDFLKQTDGNSIFLWIDNYCAQQPLTNLSDAGLELMRALTKRTSLK